MTKSGEVKASIYNMNGQIIHNVKIQAEAGINYYDYTDEKNIPAGNYIITLVSGDKRVSKKIIKSNT